MIEKQEMTIGEITNYAAANIADGWEIVVSITEGCACVALYDDEGNGVSLSEDDDLEKSVKEAVAYSREHSENT